MKQDKSSNQAFAAMEQGDLLYRQKNYSKALDYYQKAIELNPQNKEVYNKIGACFLQQRQLTSAKCSFQQGLALDEHNLKAHHFLGIIAYEEGDCEDAIFHFQQILTVYPTHVETLVNMAAAYLKQGRENIALELFHSVLTHAPYQKEALSNLAAIYLMNKNHDQAVKYYLDLLQVAPIDYSAHFNLGVIFMGLQRWEDAAFHYEMALSINPEDADAHNNYATTLIKQGFEEEAICHYEKALALQPNNEALQYRLASLKQQKSFNKAPTEYVVALFDHYADYFDETLTKSLGYQAPKLIGQRLELLLDSPCDILVDLGCGTGLCGEVLRPLTQQLIGVDISSNMLQWAQAKQVYDALFQQDIIDYLSKQNKFADVLVAGDVFCYFGALQELLEACYQFLKPTGLLLFTVEESQDRADFQLQKTGRFCHRADFIIASLKQAGFVFVECQEVLLRQQNKASVRGLLVVAAMYQI